MRQLIWPLMLLSGCVAMIPIVPMNPDDQVRAAEFAREHLRTAEGCFAAQLPLQPNLNGRVSIEITVEPQGRVIGEVVTQDTLRSPPVRECLRQQVRSWLFPALTGITRVGVAWTFRGDE